MQKRAPSFYRRPLQVSRIFILGVSACAGFQVVPFLPSKNFGLGNNDATLLRDSPFQFASEDGPSVTNEKIVSQCAKYTLSQDEYRNVIENTNITQNSQNQTNYNGKDGIKNFKILMLHQKPEPIAPKSGNKYETVGGMIDNHGESESEKLQVPENRIDSKLRLEDGRQHGNFGKPKTGSTGTQTIILKSKSSKNEAAASSMAEKSLANNEAKNANNNPKIHQTDKDTLTLARKESLDLSSVQYVSTAHLPQPESMSEINATTSNSNQFKNTSRRPPSESKFEMKSYPGMNKEKAAQIPDDNEPSNAKTLYELLEFETPENNTDDRTISQQNQTVPSSYTEERSENVTNGRSTVDNTIGNRKETRTSSGTNQGISRNLYEVLGASPDDTRSELKRKYVALAKITHPDATRGRSSLDEGQTDLNFSEIAAAWRILSDPRERKRYDRSLRAQKWTCELQTFAEKFSEDAGPQIRNIVDSVAMPFLRRTTATTLAGIQAAAKDFSQSQNRVDDDKPELDLGKTFMSAIKAARRAGRMIDDLELMEKSEQLEKQVIRQIEEANRIKDELDSVIMQRCYMALRIPNATFTSMDALSLVSYWNISTSRTFLERALMKEPVDKKIQHLEMIEIALSEKDGEYSDALANYRQIEKAVRDARAEKTFAAQRENKAKQALEQARRRVSDSKMTLNESTKALARCEKNLCGKGGVEDGDALSDYKHREKALQNARAERTLAIQAVKKSATALAMAQRHFADSTGRKNDLMRLLSDSDSILQNVGRERERLKDGVTRQQEVVRSALQKKEEILGLYGSESREKGAWDELEVLERREKELAEKYGQLEVVATETQSTANKLKERANLLKNMD